MQIKPLCTWACCLMFCVSGASGQSATPKTEPPDPCKIKVDQPACSYTGLNGSCTITINRLSPVTPPTIYAKTNAVITVKVANPSPFEDLTLDWSSTTVVVPPDSLASLLSSSVTGVVGKIQVVHVGNEVGVLSDPAPVISKEQADLATEINRWNPLAIARPVLHDIRSVLQLPGNTCWASSPQSPLPNPWLQTVDWKAQAAKILNQATSEALAKPASETEATTTALEAKIDSIDQEIASSVGESGEERDKLEANQKALRDDLNARIASSRIQDLAGRFQALNDALKAIPDHDDGLPSGQNTIQDAQSHDKNDQNQVWVLNYVNKLNPVAKRVSSPGALAPDLGALGSLTDSSKQQLVKLTVQFQHPLPLEVTSGLLVPTQPYHSYTKAAVASNGVVTNNVVQQNLTYTVVPAVFVHFVLHEFTGTQRVALFGTVATGYNPASSAVEFGIGPSFSWHSIVFSGLADIGRDTDLRGGFKVGQSLGLTNAANPLTGTIWKVKPSLAVSVRIPLGGASK